MMNKEQLLILYSDILFKGEAEINAHLDDESHTGVVALSQRVGKQVDCDPMLAYQIIKSYVEGRDDIETGRGRNGGIRRVQSKPLGATPSIADVLSEPIVPTMVPLNKQPTIAELLSTPIPPIVIVEKTEELKEVPLQSITIVPDVFDSETPLPTWATATVDPRARA